LLRLEGLAILVGSLVLYFHADFGRLLLVVLFFVPDLSFVACALGPRLGAAAHDALHTELFPIALGVAAVVGGSDRAAQLGLIWLGHIGLDPRLRPQVPDRFQGHPSEPPTYRYTRAPSGSP
jgi:hypothetical protein